MKNLFKRNQDDGATPAIEAIREARQFLPSSAKSPDAQRLNLFDPDEEIDENNDEDLAFLNSLAADAAVPRVAIPKHVEPSAPPTASPTADDLEVFREIAALRQRTELAKQLRVDDVDMGELLEDLQTTRAALRQHRKAA